MYIPHEMHHCSICTALWTPEYIDDVNWQLKTFLPGIIRAEFSMKLIHSVRIHLVQISYRML